MHNHVVSLTGTVPWHYQREAARRAIADLAGVHEVRSTITLRPPNTVSATRTKAKISAALIRNAQTEADHIKVSVNGSEITLTGAVGSAAERRQAEYAAYAAPGVTHVHNQITVTP